MKLEQSLVLVVCVSEIFTPGSCSCPFVFCCVGSAASIIKKIRVATILVVTQKWGYYIPWNPTLPREAHGNVFIRNDLPLMCRGFFPHCCVL